MKKLTQWLCVFGTAALLGGCFTPDVNEGVGTNGEGDGTHSTMPSSEMAPSYLGVDAAKPEFASDRLSATRTLIDQSSTVKLQANFLRIDEDIKDAPSNPDEHQRGLYTFNDGNADYAGAVNWNRAYLMEATLMSSPDNSPERLRSVFLDPVQTYKLRVLSYDNGDGTSTQDTTDFYHTRMVSWYPVNCPVVRNSEGAAATVLFDHSNFATHRINEQLDTNGDGVAENVVAVKFDNLDGKTDVMVSDVREAQHWHFNDGVHRSDFMPDDEDKTGERIYREPFGHFEQEGIAGVQREINYRNYFTYRHYLSAVRIFAYANQSSQNLSMWGDIESVGIANQPTSVKVWLPSEQGVHGDAYDWDDRKTIYTSGEPLFGTGDTSGIMNETAKFPVSLEGTAASRKVYLGYALVQPNQDVHIQLHTTSGIYEVTVPATFTTTDGGGNTVTEEVFEEGWIYNVHLNLETSGTIAALLLKEKEDVYYDLTKLDIFSPDGGTTTIDAYKYANCYICSPEHTTYVDGDGNTQYYDGYCFSATIVGNGATGIITQGSQTLYPQNATIEPQSARLLWESDLGLISQVELLYGYVRFKIPDRTKRGNAVIAVYDKDGKVLWSWHIWVTDPVSDQTFDTGATEIVLMDRNLGATAADWGDGSDKEAVLDTYGLYYQWGRKDPSMGPPSYNYYSKNLITSTYWDYSSREHNAAEVVFLPKPTLKDGVEDPMYLLVPSTTSSYYRYNWMDERYDFLWGYDADRESMVKTIYDPCPYGYRVPLSEISTIFSAGTLDTGDTYGQKVTDGSGTTLLFPYAGFKGVDKGLSSLSLAWNYVGSKGDYMSSKVNTSSGNSQYHRSRIYATYDKDGWTEIANLSYGAANYHDDFTNRRTAASVRCVKSAVLGSINLSLTPSIWWYLPGDNVVFSVEATTAESCITFAELTITSVDTGITRTIFSQNITTSSPVWSHDMDYVISEGGEFWSDSYVATLTVGNDKGARATTFVLLQATLYSIDFTKWTSADTADGTIYRGSTFTRAIDVISMLTTPVQPARVVVSWDEEGTPRSTEATLVATNGSTYTYSVDLSSSAAGNIDFTVEVYDEGDEVKCEGVVATTISHYPVEARIEPRDGYSTNNYHFYDVVTNKDSAQSDKLGSQWYFTMYSSQKYTPSYTLDGNEEWNNNSTTLTVSKTPSDGMRWTVATDSDSTLANDDDGVFVQAVHVTDIATGITHSDYLYHYLIRLGYADGWTDSQTVNTDFQRTLIVYGGMADGDYIVSVEVDGVMFTNDNATKPSGAGYDNYGAYSEWTGTLNYSTAATVSPTVVITMSNGNVITTTAGSSFTITD